METVDTTPAVMSWKDTASALYDPALRPDMVKDALGYLGAEKALNKFGIVNGSAEKVVDTIATLTTIAGLVEKKAELKEIAAPYVAKAYDAEGRKELAEELAATKTAQEMKTYVEEKVIKPVSAKVTAGKEYAAPYVATIKEKSAPYVEKIDELRRSERVEAMVAAFQAAREHPVEKMSELRSTAVDLIKYENLQPYREYVMSAEFQADTARLVKVDLPELAKKGKESVKTKAIILAAELESYKEHAKATAATYYEIGKEKVPSKVELEVLRMKLKASTLTLVSELQAELASGVESVKKEGFSYADIVERLKRVVAVVDKIVISPLKEQAKLLTPSSSSVDVSEPEIADEIVAKAIATATVTPAKAAEDRPIVATGANGGSVTDDDDDTMHDATEGDEE